MMLRLAAAGVVAFGLAPGIGLASATPGESFVAMPGDGAPSASAQRAPSRKNAREAAVRPPSRPVDLLEGESPDGVRTSGEERGFSLDAPSAATATGFVLPPPRLAVGSASARERAEAFGLEGPVPPPRPAFDPPTALSSALLPPVRPGFAWDDPVETASVAAPGLPSPASRLLARPEILPATAPFDIPPARSERARLDEQIARHAKANGIPEALVHRVVIRESRYNPRAVGRGGALGLMQIKQATARGMGYGGTAAGLLDAETNLTYAVRYLAGAYRVAGGDDDRAVRNYARGYYYEAKRQGFAPNAFVLAQRDRLIPTDTTATSQPLATPPPPPPMLDR